MTTGLNDKVLFQKWSSNPRTDALKSERDRTQKDEIAKSPLKSKLKRADTAAYEFVNDHREVSLENGIRQNIVPAKNKFKPSKTIDEDSAETGPVKYGAVDNAYGSNDQSGGGDDGLAISNPKAGAYDDVEFIPEQQVSAYDDDEPTTESVDYFAPPKQEDMHAPNIDGKAYGGWNIEEEPSNEVANNDDVDLSAKRNADRDDAQQSVDNRIAAKPFTKFQKLTHFAHNIRTNFGAKKDRRELPNQDELRIRNHHESVFNRYGNKSRAKNKHIQNGSVIARWSKSAPHMPVDYQRNFFAKKWRKLGYPPMPDDFFSGKYAAQDDPNKSFLDKVGDRLTACNSWFQDKFGDSSKAERGRFALEWAMTSASYQSLKDWTDRQAVGDKSVFEPGDTDLPEHFDQINFDVDLETFDPETDMVEVGDDHFKAVADERSKNKYEAARKRRFGYKDQVARGADHSEWQKDRFRLMTKAGVRKGLKALNWALNDENFNGDEAEKTRLRKEFVQACKDYNADVKKNIATRNTRRKMMSDSVLPELGMAMKLRSKMSSTEAKAYEKRFNTEVDAIVKPQTEKIRAEIKEKRKDRHQFKAAALLAAMSVTVLPLVAFGSKSVRKWFSKHLVGADLHRELNNRVEDVEARAQKSVQASLDAEHQQACVNKLKQKNRQFAYSWVKREYSYTPENKKLANTETLFDPHGFYAAIGNAKDEQVIKDNIRDQIMAADGYDPSANVDEMSKLDRATFETKKEVYTEMANEMWAGMLDALVDTAEPQLRLRADVKLTQDADNYVMGNNTYMRMVCTEAWQGVDDILNSYRDPEKRAQIALRTGSKANGEIKEIRRELDSADDHGVFVGMSSRYFDAEEEEQLYKLPLDGQRRKDMEANLNVADEQMDAATRVSNKLNSIFGAPDDTNTIAHIEKALDDDLARGMGGYGTEAKDEGISFDVLSDELAAVKKEVSELKGSGLLLKHQEDKLDLMVSDLSYRIEVQKELRVKLQDVEKQLVAATCKDDLHKDFSAIQDLTETWGYYTNDLKEDSPVINKGKLNPMIDKLKHEVKMRVSAMEHMFAARDFANIKMKEVEEKYQTGEYTLDEALHAAKQVCDDFKYEDDLNWRSNVNLDMRWDKDEADRDTFVNFDLAHKFDGVHTDLTQRMGKMIVSELGAKSGQDDKLTADAARGVRRLMNAGMLSEPVIEAFREQLGNEPTLKDVDTLLSTLGGHYHSVTQIADVLLNKNPSLALKFKTAMARNFIAIEPKDVEDMRGKHFAKIAQLAIANSQNRGAGFNKKKSVEAEPKKPIENEEAVKKSLKNPDNDAEVFDLDTDNEDEDEVVDTFDKTNPFREEPNTNPFAQSAKPQVQQGKFGLKAAQDAVDTFVDGNVNKLLYKDRQEDLRKAAANLKDLVDPDKAAEMTPEERSRGMRLAEEMQLLNSGHHDELVATRRKLQQQQAEAIKQQIQAELGIDPNKGMDDTKHVRKCVALSIANKDNIKGLQTLARRRQQATKLLVQQQAAARDVKAALLEPFKQFGELLQDAGVTGEDDPEEILRLLRGPKFRKHAKLLEDLCGIIDNQRGAVDKKQKAIKNGDDVTQSDRFQANLRALAELAPRVRNFDADKLKADNKVWAHFRMWMKDENPADIANDLANNKKIANVADRFAAVWKHVRMMQFLENSNEGLTKDLEDVQNNFNNLLGKVQKHRGDQAVRMAVMEDFRTSGQTLAEYKFDDHAVERVKAKLTEWQQPDLWDGFAERHSDLVASGTIDHAMLDNWRAESATLPSDLQNEITAAEKSLADFEELIKATTADNAKLVDTPLNRIKAKVDAIEAKHVSEAVPTTAADDFRWSLDPKASWHKHAAWAEQPSVEDMSEMKPAEFLNTLKNGLTAYAEPLSNNKENEAKDKAWVSKLKGFADDLATYNQLVEDTLMNKECGLKPTKGRLAKIAEYDKKLNDAAAELNPKTTGLRTHRYKWHHTKKRHWMTPRKTDFLNRVDAALHKDIVNTLHTKRAALKA